MIVFKLRTVDKHDCTWSHIIEGIDALIHFINENKNKIIDFRIIFSA